MASSVLSFRKLIVLLILATAFLYCFQYFFARYLQEETAEYDETNFAYSPSGYQYLPYLNVIGSGDDILGSAVVADQRHCAVLLSETASARVAVFDDINFCHLKPTLSELADEPNGSVLIVPPVNATVKSMQAYAGKDIGEIQPQVVNNSMTGSILTKTPSISGAVNSSGTSATSINLGSNASSVDGYYTNAVLAITSGPAANNVRIISNYIGSTKIATIYSTSDQIKVSTQSPQAGAIGLDFTSVPTTNSNYSIWIRTGNSAFTSTALGDQARAMAVCGVYNGCKAYSVRKDESTGKSYGMIKTGTSPVLLEPETILWT